eukprot:scaffold33632_cov135-Isochrysis_galbana.AAC.5
MALNSISTLPHFSGPQFYGRLRRRRLDRALLPRRLPKRDRHRVRAAQGQCQRRGGRRVGPGRRRARRSARRHRAACKAVGTGRGQHACHPVLAGHAVRANAAAVADRALHGISGGRVLVRPHHRRAAKRGARSAAGSLAGHLQHSHTGGQFCPPRYRAAVERLRLRAGAHARGAGATLLRQLRSRLRSGGGEGKREDSGGGRAGAPVEAAHCG